VTDSPHDMLVEHLQEAHAMEQAVMRMLDSMISETKAPDIRDELRHHREETERHERLLTERLVAHGSTPSRFKQSLTIGGALVKGVGDKVRSEKPLRNARDGFMTEHIEIAVYELLERIAERAGDEETAEVARRNRADEEAMAEKIASNWDRFVTLTLEEEGIAAPD
jgi:ferritin-like metal-binding protein YciE